MASTPYAAGRNQGMLQGIADRTMSAETRPDGALVVAANHVDIHCVVLQWIADEMVFCA